MVSYQENIINDQTAVANNNVKPVPSQPHDQAAFEADKRAVYKHPLFPLLALLFERCEQATQSAESASSESFNIDIQAFVQHQERDQKPFLINDAEVDGLMIKAIQVLRIHLLELEKVQELCKDFCNRYITCLKGKMQSENLLRSDYASGGFVEHSNTSSGHSSDSSSPISHSPHPHLQVLSSTGSVPRPGRGGDETSVLTEMGQYDNSNQHSPPTISAIKTSSVSMFIQNQENINLSGCLSPSSAGSGDEDDDLFLGKKRQKRGILPKHATSIMRSWLFQHLVHPYPTEEEKRHIATQTNLTLLQVNNWFINARRRILQPMLDASCPGDPTTFSDSKWIESEDEDVSSEEGGNTRDSEE